VNSLHRAPLGQRFKVAPGGRHAHRELLTDLSHGDALLPLDKAEELFLPFEARDGKLSFHKRTSKRQISIINNHHYTNL
jgi:hypothetical protein